MTTQPAFDRRLDSITGFAHREHGRLDLLLRRASAEAEAGRVEAARAAAQAFCKDLAGHIALEEQLLFTLFEARAGIVGGPTATLRQEHREIEGAARLVCDALRRGDLAAFQEARRFLEAVRAQHESKEEHVLYPTTDRMLSDQERGAVMERLARR